MGSHARGWIGALGALLVSGAAARADVGGEVAVGGGVHAGDPVTALDARADWAAAGGGAALGLGVRVRTIGGGFDRGDWDSADDWAAILRYLVVRRDDGAAELVAGAQPVLSLGDGALIDGVVPAALLDRRATGAHARVRAGHAVIEAVIDDVVAPTVIGARGVLARDADPDRGARLAFEVAADPGGPAMSSGATSGGSVSGGAVSGAASGWFGAAAVSGSLSTAYRAVTDRIELGARAESSRAAGAWLAASPEASRGDTRVALRAEVTAGTSHDVAAPFGPLDAILRAQAASAGAPVPPVASAGLGGAVRLTIDALAVRLDAEMRARPGTGGEYEARLVAPAFADVQLAALVAGDPGRGLVVAGGALRAPVGRRAFVGVEAARQYELAMASGARPVWQATAWLGVATAP